MIRVPIAQEKGIPNRVFGKQIGRVTDTEYVLKKLVITTF